MAMPSASYSVNLRVAIRNEVGMLGRFTSAIGSAGGDIGSLDIVEVTRPKVFRDVVIRCRDEEHAKEVVHTVEQADGVEVVSVSDRTFQAHLGGKIATLNRVPVKTRDDLSMVYTPGVARVCEAIAEDPSRAHQLTIKANTVAVVSDGTAVLGLGDIGPLAAMPVMEGKCMLFKEFGGVDAFPICLATKNPDEIVETVRLIAPAFGGINLEDISAPRCFEIEAKLREALDIPVFHDDQHGTAVVVLAALYNALRVVGKEIRDARVVVVGMGSAGVAITKLLITAGARDIVGVDKDGILDAAKMDPVRAQLAGQINPRKVGGGVAEALSGADVLIGVSAPRAVSVEAIRQMAPDRIVCAMANPIPEVLPEEIAGEARVIATGRSDYPNQINNVLCFPGLFRGVLDCHAHEINEEMKLAAAQAIAAIVGPTEMSEDYIIPSVFNRKVAPAIARAVEKAARASGAAPHRYIHRTHFGIS
ncbi:MAG: NAD-dependent malic enzyme [Actinomycetota bacterium]